MNKYYLENSFSDSFCITDFINFITRGFSGFGFDIDIDYIRIAETYINDTEEIKQRKLKFTVEIVKNVEENYKKLTNFLIKNRSDLKFVCKKGEEKIYIDVDLIALDKKENAFTYTIDFEFACRSLWYKKINKKYTLSATANENRWNCRFPFKISDVVAGVINVTNEGHVESPFILEIFGFCQNPVVKINNQYGKTEEIKFNTTLQMNDKLIFCTKDDDLFVKIVRANGESENGYNTLDFTKNNFIKLLPGENVITIEKNILKANLILYEGYLTI